MAFPILGSGSLASGYNIENSLRFNETDDPNLKLAISSDGDRRACTISMWVKRSHPTERQIFFYQGDDNGQLAYAGVHMEFQGTGSGGHLFFYGWQSNAEVLKLQTNGVFRDPAAWYHIVANIDTEQETEADRASLYINGEKQTTFSATAIYPSRNSDLNIGNNADDYIIGGVGLNFEKSLDGYLADVAFVDGTQYAASEFGEFDNNSGIWKPKEPDVTWGAKGFFLEFKQTGTGTNSSGMGADTSGNDNHLASNNLAAIDQCTDTPTNNFCTANPLNKRNTSTLPTYAEGNLKITSGDVNQTNAVAGTIAGLKRGKWYYEVKPTAIGATGTMRFGIIDTDDDAAGGLWNSNFTSMYVQYNGNKYRGGSGNSSFGNSYAANDIISVAFDLDNGAIYFAKNGTWQNSGDPTSGASKTGAAFTDIVSSMPSDGYMPAWNQIGHLTQEVVEANFGNPSFSISSGNADARGYGNFEYAVPSGYYALCTKNLAEFG